MALMFYRVVTLIQGGVVSALDVIKATDREDLLSLSVRPTGQSGGLNPFSFGE